MATTSANRATVMTQNTAQILTRLLGEIAAIAANFKLDGIRRDALDLKSKAETGRIYIACTGLFKRGKSTLLNAILNRPILPSGVVPLTSVVTLICHGNKDECKVHFMTGSISEVEIDDLEKYVTERGNPGNRLGVAAVEVMITHSLLENGLCFADTPGIGSLRLSNTEVSRAFLPKVDACLVVLGVDPPLAAEEMNLIESVAAETQEQLFVINKSDRSSDSELEEGVLFIRNELVKRFRDVDDRLFCVSALNMLRNQTPSYDWAAFYKRLSAFATRLTGEDVTRRELKSTCKIVAVLENELVSQVEALKAPIAQAEAKTKALSGILKSAEQSLSDLDALMMVEENHLRVRFNGKSQEFVNRVLPELRGRVDAFIQGNRTIRTGALRSKAISYALKNVEEIIPTWQAETGPLFDEQYSTHFDRFRRSVAELFTKLDRNGALGIPLESDSDITLSRKRHFYFTALYVWQPNSFVDFLSDFLLPSSLARKRLARQIKEYEAVLLEANTSRTINDYLLRVEESRSSLKHGLISEIRTVCETAQRALDRAAEFQLKAAEEKAAELKRYDAALAAVKIVKRSIFA